MNLSGILTFLCFVWFLQINPARAQDNTQIYITATYNNKPLAEVISDLEARYPLRFFYKNEWIAGEGITISLTNEPLAAAVEKLLARSRINFILYDVYTIVLLKDPAAPATTDTSLTASPAPSDTAPEQENTAPSAKNTSAGFKKFGPDKNGQKVRVSGNIREKSTGDAIMGATIYVEELKAGTVTNNTGFYSLSIPTGTYNITYNYIGYKPEKKQLQIKASQTLNVELFDQAVEMQEVTVFGEAADRNIAKPEMSVARLDIKTIRKMPALMGEVDIVKSLLLLPGVTTVGEGATGFNVRGGSTDQNLILLDHAPVYNSSHLFGLFSVFNPDIVKDVTLYRGGIPAQYGGRIASVLDISLREAATNKWTGKGGIGLVSNRIALEGPIIPKKLSVMIAARGSYADWLLKMVPNESVKGTQAHFYDINGKIDYLLNDKNKISLSGYLGKDVFRLPADTIATVAVNASSTVFNWGNSNATLRWTHAFSKRLFSNAIAVYSKYTSKIVNPEGPNAFDLPARIDYRNLEYTLTYFSGDKHKTDAGASIIQYVLSPGSLLPRAGSLTLPVLLNNEHALESALYMNDEFRINSVLTLMYGVRFSMFQNMGPGQSYTYEEGVPREIYTIIDTTNFRNGQVARQYQGFEPRLSAKISLNSSSSVKLSYNRMRQYIHLISNTTAAAPTDRWKLSDQYIQPQIGDQVAVGFFKNFLGNAYETSVEVYYKEINNIIDYKDGASLLLNTAIEADLLAGRGKAYGLEAQVKKTVGRLTGWASYTYSRTFIQVDGQYPEERINRGQYYPANFDKPHNLNLVMTFQKNRRWNLSANFIYSTGRPVTYPESKYLVGGVAVANYELRNQYRIPDYHRLDVSATMDGNHRRNKKWDGSWTFSIYNLYGRRNAYSVFFRAASSSAPEAYKLSIFASAFPSITYNFKF